MEFKFHLYVQRHFNRTYTVTPLPFFDLTAYGNNLEEIKTDIAEALKERMLEINPSQLNQFEFNPKINLQKVVVEMRPTDRKKRNKRREKLRLTFSLLIQPEEEGQFYVRVPKLGQFGPSYYAYTSDEIYEQAQVEITSWLDNASIEQLQSYQYARSESLEVLDLEVPIKKVKERVKDEQDADNPFGTPKENFWALKEVGINMTAQLSEGRFKRTYRRDELVEDVMQSLAGSRNNSILLIGQSETGKTAIVHEVIRRINRKDCPEALFGREVWMLSPDRIIAGAQFIGTWEERVNNIVDECRKKQHILYVEDLPGLLEVGRWSKSDANVGLALRPHVMSGEVTIIGEGLPDRVTMGDNLGPSFMNAFRRIEIPPMSEEEALAVLNHVARDLEREYNLRILPEANSMVVQLTRRFVPYRAFPGKSIRLMEECASSISRAESLGKSASTSRAFDNTRFNPFRRRPNMDRQSVMSTFSRLTGMPEFMVNDAARLELKDVESYFFDRILGQQEAVSQVVNLIATIKAGLNDPQKPLGTFMFIGPTGVGKTQMAKTLATYLFGDPTRLVRFDMSEYRDIDGVPRLIGAFGKEGELTRRVREQPFSVILLDEFEKADPHIFDIFLQVLGEGRLTDSGGKTTFFHNTIIIMTSNLGASSKNFSTLGFSVGNEVAQSAEVDDALRDHYRQQVVDFFRPEFVNRIDHVVVFGQLAPAALRNIATRELGDILLRDGITRRNLLVEIEDTVIDLVLKEGYSPVYGARPLKRAIEQLVVAPMARELSQRSVQDTNLLRISVDRGTQKLMLKNVPIDQAPLASIELRTGLTETSVSKLRLDSAQLVEGFAMVRRKLADWIEDTRYKDMLTEKMELLDATKQPNFWDNGDDARSRLSRFYFVDRLVRRVQETYDKAEYLEDFAVLVNRERDMRYQGDLARDYEELYRNTAYLDIELRTAHLPHRNKCMMLLKRMGTVLPNQRPTNIEQDWMRRLARMYLVWAEQKAYDRDAYLLMPDRNAPGGQGFQHLRGANFRDLMKKFESADYSEEIALLFEGSNVFGFLKGERGLHRLEQDIQSADELIQVTIYAMPDGTNITDWLRDYREIKVDIDEGRRPAPRNEKLNVIRIYSLDRGAGERFIRDVRTNQRTLMIKEVMEKGELDEFILALLETETDNNAWEDRFPLTFPY